MKRLMFLAVAAAAVPAIVTANSAAAHGAKLGTIFWAEEYCKGRPSPVADNLHVRYEAPGNPDKSDFESGATTGYKLIESIAADMGIANACSEVARRYGPTGVVHPNLWIDD